MGKELELAIKIAGKVDKSLGTAVNNAQSQLNSISKFTNKAMTAATVAVAAAGVKLVKDSVETYKDYQSAISSAAATGGIERGTADYEALDKAAREAGRTTVKTAEESANALEYMMLAGWNVQDSTKALMPVLKLSAATGADLATTSDLVTDSMANMGLGINDLNRYLDISAAANNKTNQTATQLLEAYIGVGGTLKNLNAPVEESAAVLGVLANRGTKGAEAGTALSAILVNMQKRTGEASEAMAQLGVSMYDSNGDARSIIDVFQDISDKTSGMTEQQRNLMYQMIGGKSHVDSFSKIMAGFNDTTADGTKEIYSLIDAFNQSGGALDNLYAIKTDTLEGSFATLNSALDDMKISIGERIAPMLKGAVDNMIDKVPQIQEVIISALEKLIPAAEKAFNFLINNSDKIISGAINMAKAFAMFKIGTGFVKGVNLFKDLYKIASKVGGGTVLKGIAGTFTGLGTSAAGAAGGITTFLSAIAPVAGVVAAVGAAILIAKGSYDLWYNSTYKWGDGLMKQADAIEKQANEYSKLAGYRRELQNLQLIVNSSNSTTEQVTEAQNRIKEIAELLNNEYNLNINTDNADLSKVAEDARTIVDAVNAQNRGTLEKDIASYANNLNSKKGLYQTTKAELPAKKVELDNMKQTKNTLGTATSSAVIRAQAYDLSPTVENLGKIQEIARDLDGMGLYDKVNEKMPIALRPEDIKTSDDVTNFLSALHQVNNEVGNTYGDALGKYNDLNNSVTEFEKSATKTGAALQTLLADDVMTGNAYGIEANIEKFTEIGQTLREAGAPTTDLAMKFAAAKEGFTDFQSAIDAGAAEKMKDNFIEYSKSIGETTENAVQGAALIANGFDNVAAATAKGDDAVLAVINDLQKIGDTQGLFEGLDANGVADKLTDMAHAMQLIPENKSIAIDAEGNLSVIQEAENQIASLNSIGNVDVTVNANGDITIMDEASNLTGVLQGFGAVSLQVNAEGNIEVLDKAQEVIATIDSKSAQINIDGQAYGLEQIQQAKQTADGLHDKSVTAAVVGSFNGQDVIATAVDYQSKLQDVSRSQTVTGKFPGKSDIATAISYQSQLHDKSVTHTVTYVQKGTPPPNNATGTSNWRGGLTYINDQKISDPREVIEHNGMRYWYEGKNVLANIPRGARIYNAAESRAFINGSHRNGLTRVPFDGYIAELHQGERVLTSEEASEYGDYRLGDYLDMLLEIMDDAPRNSGGSDDNSSQRIVFSPTYHIEGGGDPNRVREVARLTFNDFKDFMEEYERDRARKTF